VYWLVQSLCNKRLRGETQVVIPIEYIFLLELKPKSSIEVTICTSSNILVWFGRDTSEKSVAGLRESLISSPFENAKGLEKYRK
jgi:hypothetical protein